MEIETYGRDIKTVEEVVDLIDQIHSKAMEGCGAIDDLEKTSPALDFMNKVLDYAQELQYEGDEDV